MYRIFFVDKHMLLSTFLLGMPGCLLSFQISTLKKSKQRYYLFGFAFWSPTDVTKHTKFISNSLKFVFSKKATKINKIFTVHLTLCSKCQMDGEDFFTFCGLLEKYKLLLELCTYLEAAALNHSSDFS